MPQPFHGRAIDNQQVQAPIIVIIQPRRSGPVCFGNPFLLRSAATDLGLNAGFGGDIGKPDFCCVIGVKTNQERYWQEQPAWQEDNPQADTPQSVQFRSGSQFRLS